MRQAIITKYLPVTNHRGARIRVMALAGRHTFPWRHELNSSENHYFAALEFAKELGWLTDCYLVGGGMHDNTGYCFVLVQNPELESE